jgi:hypothetical protein
MFRFLEEATGCWAFAGYRLLASGFWEEASGCPLLATGFWEEVTGRGYRLFAFGYRLNTLLT